MKTTLGTLIHFPQEENDPAWASAITALDEVAAAFPSGSYLRFDALWHNTYYQPFVTNDWGSQRLEKIMQLIYERDLLPMMVLIPLPWPQSGWYPHWYLASVWGERITLQMMDVIAERTAVVVADYRRLIAEIGFRESKCYIQIGNEPASGNPGGDATLPQGTWSIAPLLARINQRCIFGRLKVAAPALSMQDHPDVIATRERTTAHTNAESWQNKISQWALHHRFYNPNLTVDQYCDGWISTLATRAANVKALFNDLATTPSRARMRQRIIVSESYVPIGDHPNVPACWAGIVNRVQSTPLNDVEILILYRWHPFTGINPTFTFDAATRAAIAGALND